ncbi:UvrD-helicase domain-containing protein [Acinetobacter ursingii]|uniref:UvrD-helicase domain-containing protein n=1 Tax=Acinetobacter ursingii TaxID=108980 RepID=UPI00124BFE94|nr:UvrD-helicase domain-containing protein [Acinetobacter ursingii]MDI3239035.1 AAA family ATPase [Acinetobacter ursingii]
MKTNLKLAFSDGYFASLNKLPSNIQAKVNQQIMKFMVNPSLPGFNLEKLQVVKDDSFRSLRVDQTYRIIVSEQGNILLLLWVDHHDDAYTWAKTHKCNINAETGAIQLYQSEVQAVAIESQETSESLFNSLRDKQLMKLGVPEDLIPQVRLVQTEEDLDQLQANLPQDAYEGLFLYLAGQSYESILAEREIAEDSQFSTTDFEAALARDQSLAKFSVVSGETELEEMLSASLEKWRVFLHSSQRKLATGHKKGPIRVLGGAGTGKTVVAMHRAKWLAENLTDPNHKILFTTFTKNLAQDIEDQLRSLCGEALLQKIEVVNLDRWVQYFLRKQKYDFEIVYSREKLDEHWKMAYAEMSPELTLSLEFFKEEWLYVIQPQGITSLDEYKQARRVGRGTRLSRGDKIKVWDVLSEYRRLLNQHGIKEISDAYRDAADYIRVNNVNFPYQSIVVDEAQDMGPQAFKLLRAIVPEQDNDLFIVGDAHQRIYDQNKVVLSQVGINVRGRSAKLKINYRTTDEIRKFAISILKDIPIDDLDGGHDNNTLYKSLTHGPQPNILDVSSSFDDQMKKITAILDKIEYPLDSVCIVARTHNELDKIAHYFNTNQRKFHKIVNSESGVPEGVVKIATIHRVKGLEFDQIILASCNDGLIPLDSTVEYKSDLVSKEEADAHERSLVFVALTRAKKEVAILSYGANSKYLN